MMEMVIGCVDWRRRGRRRGRRRREAEAKAGSASM